MKPLTQPFPWLPALGREAAALWRLAWPILIGQIAAVGMAVSDTLMAGRLGALELAAVSLGVSCWTVVYVTLIGLMLPINAIVAHEFGAGRPQQVAHQTRQALWLAAGVGLLAMLLLNAGASLLQGLDAPAEVRDKAVEFVRIISLGLPALAGYRCLFGYSTSINQTRPMMVIALLALAYNVLANWLLIYGHWGLPQLGSSGCALATASGLWLMLAALVVWIRRAPAYRESQPLRQWAWPCAADLATLWRQGLPMGVTYLAEASAFSAVALLVAKFGIIAMASNQVALNVTSVVFVLPLSLGIALITRVGQALGAGEVERARFVAWVGVGLAIACGALSGGLIALFRHEISALYSQDPALQVATAALLLIAAIFQLSDATQISAACAVRGYKVTRPPMLIHLCAFWGIALPLGAVLGLGLPAAVLPAWPWPALGSQGFWIGLAVGLSAAALMLLRLLRRVAGTASAAAPLRAGAVRAEGSLV